MIDSRISGLSHPPPPQKKTPPQNHKQCRGYCFVRRRDGRSQRDVNENKFIQYIVIASICLVTNHNGWGKFDVVQQPILTPGQQPSQSSWFLQERPLSSSQCHWPIRLMDHNGRLTWSPCYWSILNALFLQTFAALFPSVHDEVF